MAGGRALAQVHQHLAHHPDAAELDQHGEHDGWREPLVASTNTGGGWRLAARNVVPSTRAAITRTLTAYPNITLSDPAELTQAAQDSTDQLLGLVTALLLLAVVVAILGIVNTLVLSVLERTRELGLMRAVGATRRQVRTIVRRESVLMAMLGAVTGIALGTLWGVALSRAMTDEGITTVSVPTTQLLLYLVIAAAVGVVAAIGPARRASRVDLLTAMALD